jgi:glycosyltransferase involved in cell wall biosynthesis
MSVDPMPVALLKSWDFADWKGRYGHGWQLPYRMDHLQDHGLELRWTDAVHSEKWQGSRLAPVLRRLESVSVPFAQTMLMAPAIARSPATLAMFESEANLLAALRSLTPGRRTSVLAVLTCWLAHVLQSAGRRRLAAYRFAYRRVDLLYCFSDNQRPYLIEMLGIPADRVRSIPFGVDSEEFRPRHEAGQDDGYVLVVGRDRGRDWPTLFRALGGLDIPVKVCARPSDLRGLDVPADAEILGFVDRSRYMDLLSRARVVVIASKPVIYPSGQSVLLEAMSMGRAVVITRTDALSDYLSDGLNSLVVPPGDARRLREMVLQAAGDEHLRHRLGVQGRKDIEERFNARSMWARVAGDLLELVAGRSSANLLHEGVGSVRRRARSIGCS